MPFVRGGGTHRGSCPSSSVPRRHAQPWHRRAWRPLAGPATVQGGGPASPEQGNSTPTGTGGVQGKAATPRFPDPRLVSAKVSWLLRRAVASGRAASELVLHRGQSCSYPLRNQPISLFFSFFFFFKVWGGKFKKQLGSYGPKKKRHVPLHQQGSQ